MFLKFSIEWGKIALFSEFPCVSYQEVKILLNMFYHR